MRAKRSKKYRKLMHQYELAFGFREPYQVLVDSNLLRAVHSFKMDLIPALERTLQGQVKPLLTKCSLASIMAGQPTNPRTNNPVRPDFLPPPTTLPLRHCSHNEDSTPIDETSCLLSLLSPLSDVKRNKEHYILATADPPAPKPNSATQQETGKKRKRDADDGLQALKRAQALRRGARSIPGVPIVYVKRSVMILEPMSAPSEGIRDGVEEDKLRTGLTDQSARKSGGPDGGEKKKKREPKKAKGPNPLSVKKPKKRVEQKATAKRERPGDEAEKGDSEKAAEDGEAAPKPKRRRRHHKGAKQGESGGDENVAIATAPIEATD
jgi:U3 small nucleolar RNA-associated protein 23